MGLSKKKGIILYINLNYLCSDTGNDKTFKYFTPGHITV
jgi:hypothetical protein